jgi:integrase
LIVANNDKETIAAKPLSNLFPVHYKELTVGSGLTDETILAAGIRAIANSAGWTAVADIDPDSVNRYSNQLRDKGRSNRTRAAYITAVKGFTVWLTRENKLPRDPLAGVVRPSPDQDRRYERRALHPDEWPWLEAATLNGKVLRDVEPKVRELLYRTAIQTGLRAKELRKLTRGRLFLDGDQPYILAKSHTTKNHKPAKQYILPSLASDLKCHIATKVPQAAVFTMPCETKVAAMLQSDLLQAVRMRNIAWRVRPLIVPHKSWSKEYRNTARKGFQPVDTLRTSWRSS